MTTPKESQGSLNFERDAAEATLRRRLSEHRAPPFDHVLDDSARIARYREMIDAAGLGCVIIGRGPGGKPETYQQFLDRHFGEPINAKRKVNR